MNAPLRDRLRTLSPFKIFINNILHLSPLPNRERAERLFVTTYVVYQGEGRCGKLIPEICSDSSCRKNHLAIGGNKSLAFDRIFEPDGDNVHSPQAYHAAELLVR